MQDMQDASDGAVPVHFKQNDSKLQDNLSQFIKSISSSSDESNSEVSHPVPAVKSESDPAYILNSVGTPENVAGTPASDDGIPSNAVGTPEIVNGTPEVVTGTSSTKVLVEGQRPGTLGTAKADHLGQPGTPETVPPTTNLGQLADGTPSLGQFGTVEVSQDGIMGQSGTPETVPPVVDTLGGTPNLGQSGFGIPANSGTAELGQLNEAAKITQNETDEVRQPNGTVTVEQQIQELLDKNPELSIREISEITKSSKSTVHRIIQRIRITSKDSPKSTTAPTSPAVTVYPVTVTGSTPAPKADHLEQPGDVLPLSTTATGAPEANGGQSNANQPESKPPSPELDGTVPPPATDTDNGSPENAGGTPETESGAGKTEQEQPPITTDVNGAPGPGTPSLESAGTDRIEIEQPGNAPPVNEPSGVKQPTDGSPDGASKLERQQEESLHQQQKEQLSQEEKEKHLPPKLEPSAPVHLSQQEESSLSYHNLQQLHQKLQPHQSQSRNQLLLVQPDQQVQSFVVPLQPIPESLIKKVPKLGKVVTGDGEWRRLDIKSNRDSGIAGNIYAYCFATAGGKEVRLHEKHFENRRSFMSAILDELEKYDTMIGYGIRTSGDFVSDMHFLRINCEKVGLRGRFDRISNKVQTLDVSSIFNNNVIKGFLKVAYGIVYRNGKLDTVARAYINREKTEGITGANAEFEPDPEKQLDYCLNDARLPYEMLQKNNFELLHIMYEISQEIGLILFDTCNTKYPTKWWESKLTRLSIERFLMMYQKWKNENTTYKSDGKKS